MNSEIKSLRLYTMIDFLNWNELIVIFVLFSYIDCLKTRCNGCKRERGGIKQS